MYSYTAATLAIRAKCSLSFHSLSLPNDQPFCYHHPCCYFLVSPRILSGYLLSLSSPFASKALFHAGRRRLRIFYRSDDSDMMGLLAKPEERFPGLGEPVWKKGSREIRIESIDGERRSSRKEGKAGICSSRRSDGFSSDRDSELNEVGRRRAGGESLVGFGNRKKGTRYDEAHVAEEELREVHKYVDDSWRERTHSSNRDVALDSRNNKSTMRNGSFRRLEVKDVEEKVDQRANLAQQVNIRESGSDRRSKKVTRISEVQLDDVRRTSVLANVRKIERRENPTPAASQNSVLVADYQPTGRLEKQSKIPDFRYNDARSAAYSQGDFEETSIRGRGERAYSEKKSAQVSRDKRVYLDRRALEQDESRRSTQRLNEDSLLDGSDFDRASLVDEKRVMGIDVIPNLVQDSSQLSRNNRPQIETELHLSVKNRYEGKEDKPTKAGNSIQLRGGERKQIVRGAVELDEAHRNTQRLSKVSEFGSGNKEAFSLSKENRGIEFKSYSVQSSVPATKDKGIQVEMQDAYYNYDRIEMSSANNFVNATSSWCSPVSRVDPQECGALLTSNQVSSIREQNDQANKQAYLLYGAKMESERDTSEFDLIRSNNRRISSLQDTYNSRIENEKVFPSTRASSLALIQDQEIQRSSFTGESSQSESMDMTSIGGLHGISSPQPTFSDLNYDAGWIGSQKIQHDTNYSTGVFDKSSASHVGEFVDRLQKEAVALKEVGKIPDVIDGVQIGKQGRRDVQATIRIENRNETSSTVSTQERKERQSNLLVGESSQYKTLKIASTGSLGDVSSPVETYSETDNHSHRDDIRHITNNAIESAKRLDKSSAFLVDEFVDEMQQEILNESGKESNVYTRFQIEETGRRESHKAAGMQVGELTESRGYGDGRDKKEGRRQSSSGLEMSGPSEEMWGFQVASSLETSNAEGPGENSPTSEAVDLTTPLETAIARRSPKSLWSYVADIIRMSWILQGNSHSKTSKSEKRTSSNESLSSDAWFSGPEPEEDVAGDEAQNTKKAGLLKESGLVKESVKLPLQESKKGDRITVIEPNSSISSGFMTSGLSDRAASSSVEAEHTQDSKSSQATLSSVAIVEQQLASKSDAALPSITDIGESRVRDRVRVLKPSSSFPAAVARVGFSSSITQATGAEQMEAVQVWDGNNSSLEKFEQPPLASMVDSALPRITDVEEVDRPGNIPKMELDPFSEKLPEVGGTQEAGIKRRKFQRSKQVLSEQLDEWEEAFKRENEQKKADEFFMREAILEAKKGADVWEVPVGAVLVQNGRIIARGCNMVEELRDSTSHAEMICIREASNVLRTWRLAETTLYVTLEPCPMCAGAILQARIDTVVWGAPNRLLGADGSWVRLFPGGDGGSSSMNPPSQMVGPVHPFHPKITIRRGVLEAECGDVMQQFFKLRRKKDKKPESSPPPSCLPISNRPTKFFSKLHNIFGMMFCL